MLPTIMIPPTYGRLWPTAERPDERDARLAASPEGRGDDRGERAPASNRIARVPSRRRML